RTVGRSHANFSRAPKGWHLRADTTGARRADVRRRLVIEGHVVVDRRRIEVRARDRHGGTRHTDVLAWEARAARWRSAGSRGEVRNGWRAAADREVPAVVVGSAVAIGRHRDRNGP